MILDSFNPRPHIAGDRKARYFLENKINKYSYFFLLKYFPLAREFPLRYAG